MPNVVKIIIKDKFTNKLIALKLKEATVLTRVIDILKKRYDHLKGKQVALYLQGEELGLNLSLQQLVEEKNYTEKQRIELREKASAPEASIAEPNYVEMMSQGGDQFDQAVLEILVKRKVITREVGDSSLKSARSKNTDLITNLIKEDYIAEKDIITNISRFLEIPSIDLDSVNILPEISKIIQQKEAEYYCVSPIRPRRK